MFNVTFLEDFRTIPKGFSFDVTGIGGVNIDGIRYEFDTFLDLADLGITHVVPVDETCNGCCVDETACSNPVSAQGVASQCVTAYLEGVERNKVVNAVGDDLNNYRFAFGDEYKFYDIENKTWKVSRLKKTASHLGRIVGGFAVPLNATNKKMFNRLEKLNVMYDLGLNRETCRTITNYYN